MRANVVKTVVNSVPHEGIDAVGVERTIPENPLRRKSDQKHWYIAIVNNKSEKLCRDKLEKRIASQPEGEKDYEVYIASQKEMCLLPSGKRKQVDRIVFRSIVFIRCTDVLRRKEIVHLPYIKRFMVNIAGERSGNSVGCWTIPKSLSLSIPVRCLLERGYALTAVSCMV